MEKESAIAENAAIEATDEKKPSSLLARELEEEEDHDLPLVERVEDFASDAPFPSVAKRALRDAAIVAAATTVPAMRSAFLFITSR